MNDRMAVMHLARLRRVAHLMQDGEEFIESGMAREENFAKRMARQRRSNARAGEGFLVVTDRRLLFLEESEGLAISWPYPYIEGHDLRRFGRFGPARKVLVLSLFYRGGDVVNVSGGQTFMSMVTGVLKTKEGKPVDLETTPLTYASGDLALRCGKCRRVERVAVAYCNACACLFDWQASREAVDLMNADVERLKRQHGVDPRNVT